MVRRGRDRLFGLPFVAEIGHHLCKVAKVSVCKGIGT